MIKLPKQINILSDIYSVDVIEGTFISSKGTAAQGEFCYDDKVIKIKKLSDASMLKTLLHEIIHGICIDLNLYDGEPHDEAFIDRLSAGLVDTLIRNKMVEVDK